MNTAKQTIATRPLGSKPRLKWLAVAGLAASLTIPLSASADHDGDAALNLLVGATVAYALVDAVDGFDNDRNRRRGGDHRGDHRGDRHDGANRRFNGDYQHRDKHWRRYLRERELRHRGRHHQRHAYRHGNRHGYRAHGYRPRTQAPHWYAHR